MDTYVTQNSLFSVIQSFMERRLKNKTTFYVKFTIILPNQYQPGFMALYISCLFFEF